MNPKAITFFIFFVSVVTIVTHNFFYRLRITALIFKKKMNFNVCHQVNQLWIDEEKVNRRWTEIEQLILERYDFKQFVKKSYSIYRIALFFLGLLSVL